jgi:hypothetical protein
VHLFLGEQTLMSEQVLSRCQSSGFTVRSARNFESGMIQVQLCALEFIYFAQ